MAKTLNRLTSNEIKAAHSGTNLNDGGGLFYRADKTPGSGQWKFRFTSHDLDFVARQTANGSATRKRDMGLGTYPTTSLASARAKVAPLRIAVDAGHDPIEDARREAEAAKREAADAARVRAAEEMTLGRYADDHFLPVMLPQFANAAHIQQWQATFATHATTCWPSFCRSGTPKTSRRRGAVSELSACLATQSRTDISPATIRLHRRNSTIPFRARRN